MMSKLVRRIGKAHAASRVRMSYSIALQLELVDAAVVVPSAVPKSSI
jgi:hypothetical protein